MEVRTRSVKGCQFWTASGGRLAIITVALQLPFFGNGFGSKPQGKIRSWESLWQFVVVLSLILATPATSLVPNCNGPAVSLHPSPTWRGGGGWGHAAWATACPPHNTAQAHIHSYYTYYTLSKLSRFDWASVEVSLLLS